MQGTARAGDESQKNNQARHHAHSIRRVAGAGKVQEVRGTAMIDLSTMNIILIVWTLAMFIVWSWLVVASRADDEAEKMGRIRRVK
jgi:hypothetical protein